MISDRLPTLGASPVEMPRGRRLLGRALARPSLPALVGLVVVVIFFGVQAPALLTTGGLASVLDSAAPLGIGAVAVALLLIAGQFDLSIGVLAAGELAGHRAADRAGRVGHLAGAGRPPSPRPCWSAWSTASWWSTPGCRASS